MKVQSIETHEQNDVDMEGASKVKMRMLIGPQEEAPTFHIRGRAGRPHTAPHA